MLEIALTPCHYCGMPADTTDHVVPRMILEMIARSGDPQLHREMVERRQKLTVDACRECNGLLAASYQDTLDERKAALKFRLAKRYRRYLDLPDWNDHEILELSDRLRDRVIASLEMQRILRRRLAW